jgi:hypothetical protein
MENQLSHNRRLLPNPFKFIIHLSFYDPDNECIGFFLICGMGLWVLRPLLAYCTSLGWYVMVIVEKLVERRLAEETEVLGENLMNVSLQKPRKQNCLELFWYNLVVLMYPIRTVFHRSHGKHIITFCHNRTSRILETSLTWSKINA